MAEGDDKKLPVYKVALSGKSDVGKTSIFRRIRGDGFLDDTTKFSHLPADTIKVKVGDKTVKIHFVDTAGMERYGRLTRQHYRGSHVVLLVYDCDDSESLQALRGFYKDAKDNTNGAAMVMVRNKIDKDFQSVDIAETTNLICDRGTKDICRFKFKAETSAKDNYGIKKLVNDVAEYLIKNVEPSNNRNAFHDRINLKEEQRQQTTPTQTKSGGCCN